MKKKHLVSLAIVLHHVCKLLDAKQSSALVSALADWCGLNTRPRDEDGRKGGFDEGRWRDVVRTGKGNY